MIALLVCVPVLAVTAVGFQYLVVKYVVRSAGRPERRTRLPRSERANAWLLFLVAGVVGYLPAAGIADIVSRTATPLPLAGLTTGLALQAGLYASVLRRHPGGSTTREPNGPMP